mmetsp:Transcript_73571/g.148841  ORF Transcript_73571/g.148841 Transcript_73571/m.148841 type:complete len:296 (+) Transcript_73571:77-964(+)
MVAPKKVIAVVDATGSQTGSLVRAILQDGTFKARALTPDINEPSAQALKRVGAEVMQFDMAKSASHQRALHGAHGVFIVTKLADNDTATPEQQQQIKDLVALCQQAGVEHIVWSNMEGTRPLPHSSVTALFPTEKTTFFHTALYLEDLLHVPAAMNEDLMAMALGSVRIPVIAKDDVGRCALGVFKAGEAFKGQSVYATGELVTLMDLESTISEATGKPFKFDSLGHGSCNSCSSSLPAIREESARILFRNATNPDWVSSRDPNGPMGSKRLYPRVHSAREWAEANWETLAELSA